MQSRVFDPNERIALELPAHMINVMMEQLQKSVPVVPYIVYQPMMIELQMQLQQQTQQTEQTEVVHPRQSVPDNEVVPRGSLRKGPRTGLDSGTISPE